MAKRLVAIFLFLSLVITITGYQAVYYFYLQQVKAEMKQHLLSAASNEVTTFVIHTDNAAEVSALQWEEETEFSLNGTMYDVLEKKQHGNTLILRCIADTKETALIRQYQQLTKNNNSAQKWASLYKLLDTHYIPVDDMHMGAYALDMRKPFSRHMPSVLSCYHHILTPPPRLS